MASLSSIFSPSLQKVVIKTLVLGDLQNHFWRFLSMDGDLRRHITLKGLSILLQPTFAHLYTMYKVLVNFKMILK